MRIRALPSGTDLPVLLPAADRLALRVAAERRLLLPAVRLDWRWGAALAHAGGEPPGGAEGQSPPDTRRRGARIAPR
ncbi:MAG: hypothetical protein O9325_12150, partial [Roseomonas sp.]|nr:hypothetical protein [Roseomonas sp.]